MCIDGNSAPLSVRYLNSQLTALWQNARDCVNWASHHGGESDSVNLSSEDYVRHKYQRALAQFHYMGAMQGRSQVKKDDLFFTASFGKPRLDFICNHEAVLYLKIEKGHLNKAYSKTKAASKAPLNRADNVPIEGVELAFRMKFSNSKIEGSDTRIAGGNGYTIQLLILDIESAKMVMFKPSVSGEIKDALNYYLHQYLHHLGAAGQNCLLNLPDFDDDAYTPTIEYSLTTKAIEADLCADVFIHGTSVSAINDQLRSAWLKVASLTDLPTDKLSACLAQIKTQWLHESTDHYHVRFAPPTVKALCEHEVVLYYNVEELKIYESGDFSVEIQTLRDFSIAFVVNVRKVKSGSGAIILELDLESAQFARHLSTFTFNKDIIATYIGGFVDFVVQTYIDLVIEYKLTVIYTEEVVVFSPGPEGPEGPHGPLTPGGPGHVHPPTVEIDVNETITYGYEQVLTITQETINIIFRSLWATAKKSSHTDVIYKWSFEQKFKATFEEPRIQLLSGGKALIWVTIASGHMHLDGHSETNISGWRLAFEVSLKQVEHKDLKVEKSWFGRFKDALFGKEQDDSKTVMHVVLDFDTAVYVHDLSSFDGVFDAGASLAILRLQAIKSYLRSYFSAFASAGHHIVHSTPIYGGVTETRLTSVTFQVVSKTTITVTNVFHKHDAPVIIIVGNTHDRPLPNVTIEWNVTLVAKKTTTVTLSSKVFLEAFLARLALVNARTTIVPRFPAEHEDEWKVYLTTWDKHGHRRNRDSGWTLVKDTATVKSDVLKYQWEHRDVWSYERTGTLETTGAYNVVCHTLNELTIPTSFRRGGMDIKITGQSAVRVAGKDEDREWSKRSSATWAALIRVSSEWDGLHVSLVDQPKPVYQKTEETGVVAIHMDTHKLLADQLPQMVDMDFVVANLKSTLEGHWKYSTAGTCRYNLYSPVFNIHGDLIVTLRIHDPSAKPPPPPPAPKAVEGPKSPVANGTTVSTRAGFSSSRPAPPPKKRSSFFTRAKEYVLDKFDGDSDDDEDSRKAPAPKMERQTTLPGSPSIPKVGNGSIANGSVNGSINGSANGHANGHANGKANGKVEVKVHVPSSAEIFASSPKGTL